MDKCTNILFDIVTDLCCTLNLYDYILEGK